MSDNDERDFSSTVDGSGVTITLEADFELGEQLIVDDAALVEGGWILEREAADYCDHDASDFEPSIVGLHDKLRALEHTQHAVERWHDRAHGGPFRFCYAQPCRGAREAVEQ